MKVQQFNEFQIAHQTKRPHSHIKITPFDTHICICTIEYTKVKKNALNSEYLKPLAGIFISMKISTRATHSVLKFRVLTNTCKMWVYRLYIQICDSNPNSSLGRQLGMKWGGAYTYIYVFFFWVCRVVRTLEIGMNLEKK